MKILLFSAYDAASHIYWRKRLVEQFPERLAGTDLVAALSHLQPSWG